MRECIQHPTYGEIVYHETWTGKKSICVNGVNAPAISSKEFVIDNKMAVLTGNLFGGVALDIAGEKIEISPKPKWYEMLLGILPFLFVLVWGNSKALCAIFPIVGGAIGGALGGLGFYLSLTLIKRANSLLEKIVIALAVLAVTVMVTAAAAALMLSLI